MVLSSTDDFAVEWAEPADGELTWTWEQTHSPRPVSPLAADLSVAIEGGFFADSVFVFVNGYPFHTSKPGGSSRPAAAQPALPAGKEMASVWFEDFLPQVRATCLRIRDFDYEALTAAQISERLDGLLAELATNFAMTMLVSGGSTHRFLNFCEAELGPAGAIEGAAMLQGHDNQSAASGLGLGRLASLATELPNVAALLETGDFAAIAAATGGDRFLAELSSYLDEYGWRVESWNNLHQPTWAENPERPLGIIRRFLTDPGRTPAAAFEAAREQRSRLIREAESKIKDPQRLGEFRALLAEAEGHVPMSESRAHWQLTGCGVIRVPVVALGSKLVEAGKLTQPDDVFFLSLTELKELVESQEPTAAVAAIPERRDEIERWQGLIPPRFLGRPPPPQPPGTVNRYDGNEVVDSVNSKIVNGNGASLGVVTGRARVIHSLDEAERLQAGDVLVCVSTAPPWTPLFSIAAAVVTDSGGLLSHSAIAAREYALPCVVGTRVGTRKIPDGALVTVDGGQGVVRIEE